MSVLTLLIYLKNFSSCMMPLNSENICRESKLVFVLLKKKPQSNSKAASMQCSNVAGTKKTKVKWIFHRRAILCVVVILNSLWNLYYFTKENRKHVYSVTRYTYTGFINFPIIAAETSARFFFSAKIVCLKLS